MKFSCTAKDMQTLLKAGYYRVPRFQRPYSWTREEIEELWSDVLIDTPPGHFIGSIVAFTGSDHYSVVDGQQRLITITIVLCCIRNELQSAGHNKLANGLHATLIERPDLTSEPKCVLQPETSEEFFYDTVQQMPGTIEPRRKRPQQDEEINLSRARDYLSSKVKGALDAIRSDTTLSEERKHARIRKKLEDMRDRLLRLSLIFVKLDDEDEAYLMFETLNARGKDLRVSDLVKNHLAKHLKRKTKTVDSFKIRWEKIVRGVEGSSASIGVNEFIHHHWLSAKEYTSQKKLFKSIKKAIKKPNADAYLEELVEESSLYFAIFEPRAASWNRSELEIRRSLCALKTFGVRQPAPLVLSLISQLRKGALKPKNVSAALNAIEAFHFQFTAVASQSSSGGISQMYAKHAREVREAASLQDAMESMAGLKEKLRDRLPAADEFHAGFRSLSYSSVYTRHRDLVRYILGGVARYGLRPTAIEFDAMTIEHILPESDSTAFESQIANIGNLTLVNVDLNRKLGNRAFSAKRQKLIAAEDVWIDDVLDGAAEWGGTEIGERADCLATLAREKIWRV